MFCFSPTFQPTLLQMMEPTESEVGDQMSLINEMMTSIEEVREKDRQLKSIEYARGQESIKMDGLVAKFEPPTIEDEVEWYFTNVKESEMKLKAFNVQYDKIYNELWSLKVRVTELIKGMKEKYPNSPFLTKYIEKVRPNLRELNIRID